MFTLEEFLSKMHVEEIDSLLFKGEALLMGLPRVFGGQVLGQACLFSTPRRSNASHHLRG